MRTYIIFFFVILLIPVMINSFSPPILTNVRLEKHQNSLKISYDIEDFKKGTTINVSIFNKLSQKTIMISDNMLKGDFGKISAKKHYDILINLQYLPDDFSLDNYTCFPRLLYKGRIYYEFLRIPKGQHNVKREKGIENYNNIKEFYISKFEVSNEQFAAFIKSDGYEISEYWKVREGLMRNTEVGWVFQGKYFLSSPRKWDLDHKEYWKTAPSNFIYGPVTIMSWFEANAFCHWMGGSLPELYQIELCFAKNSVENDSAYNPVCNEISTEGKYHIHYVKSNVAEWILAVPDERIPPCGPGCKEMFYIKNDNINSADYPLIGLSCPLFCHENLGFRLVIVPNK